MSDLCEQARELEANAAIYDTRLKSLMAQVGPLKEQGPAFASADCGVCVPAHDIHRLAKVRIVHIESVPGARIARLTS